MDVADHRSAAACRRAVQFVEMSVEVRDSRQVVDVLAVDDGINRLFDRYAGIHYEHVHLHGDVRILHDLRVICSGDLLVGGGWRKIEIRVEERHQAGAAELACGLKCRHGVEVLEHACREKCALVDFFAFGALPGIDGQLVEGVEHGVDDGPLLRRNLRERVCKRHRMFAPHETHRRVLPHAEDVFGILGVERELVVDRDFLQQELERRHVGLAGAEAGLDVEFCRGVELPGLDIVMHVREPPRELVHQGKTLLEVVRVEREASAAVEELARVGVRVERGGIGVFF